MILVMKGYSMNIRHYRIFKTVCDENSVTKAANKLFMTQPAVSHVIKELETNLGYPLFDRISRRLYLTTAGEVYLDKVRQVLTLIDELESEAQNFEKEAPIRIGSSITIANFWLPEILHQFKLDTNTPVQVEIDSAAQILKKLERTEIDLAFMEGVVPQGKYKVQAFASYKLCMACSPTYPAANKSYKTIHELKDEQFLLREKGSAIRDSFDSYLTLSQLQIEPSYTSVNSQALIQAAKCSLGITVLPDMLLEKEMKDKSLVEVKVRDFALENTNFLLYHEEKYVSSSMKKIISLTKKLFL